MNKRAIEIGSVANEYHLASANDITIKQAAKGFQINYQSEITSLVKEAPLKLESEETTPLDIDAEPMEMTLAEALRKRASIRSWAKTPMPLSKLAKLLYFANGVRAIEGDFISRNVPSSGDLGSVEIYACAFRVEGLESGLYHFDSVNHALSLIEKGQFETWAREFAIMQPELCDCAALLFLVGSHGRLEKKYGLRAYRLALMDVGHVSENIYLVGAALDLSLCATNGFIDKEVNRALNLDGLEQCTLLALAVGLPKSD